MQNGGLDKHKRHFSPKKEIHRQERYETIKFGGNKMKPMEWQTAKGVKKKAKMIIGRSG